MIEDIQPPDPLLAALADGDWHSGTALAARLGVTRSAVSARIKRLRQRDIDIYSVSGRGYRLPEALDLLEAGVIRERLSAEARAGLDALVLRDVVDSTNTRVAAYADGATRALLAEQQTAGRGRSGRAWASPPAANLYLSVGHDMPATPAPLGALSLAIGVAVADALTALGVADIALKWPNDLWIGQAKLGGILIEARGEASGATRLVAGLGLNLRMPAQAASGIDQPWTRLADHLRPMPARSRIAGDCLNAVLAALEIFARDGFVSFARRWPDYDLTQDRPVHVLETNRTRRGIARGVADDGSLMVELDGRLERLYSGDVSLRPE